MAQLERALDQVKLDLEQVRAAGHAPTPTRSLGPGGADRRRGPAASCGCTRTTSTAVRRPSRSRAGVARRRSRSARQSGVPDAALRRVRRARARRCLGDRGVIEPDQPLRRRRHDRHRPRHLAGARDARPRPVARLPVPARAAAADLRRSPARADLAVLRLRLDARPGRRVPELAGHDRRRSTRGWRCPATASLSSTCTATSRPTQRLVRERLDRAVDGRRGTSREAAMRSRSTCSAQRGDRSRRRRGGCRRRSATCATSRSSGRGRQRIGAATWPVGQPRRTQP